MNTKILKRALEMACLEITYGSCNKCPLLHIGEDKPCHPKKSCADTIVDYFSNKATAEIKAKGEII